jgi:hypothetical protein
MQASFLQHVDHIWLIDFKISLACKFKGSLMQILKVLDTYYA